MHVPVGKDRPGFLDLVCPGGGRELKTAPEGSARSLCLVRPRQASGIRPASGVQAQASSRGQGMALRRFREVPYVPKRVPSDSWTTRRARRARLPSALDALDALGPRAHAPTPYSLQPAASVRRLRLASCVSGRVRCLVSRRFTHPA